MSEIPGTDADLDPDGGPEPDPIVLTVPPAAAGTRLDSFLADNSVEHSRSRIHRDIAEGRVLVDGAPRPKSHRLEAGEEVRYRPGRRPALTASPQDLPLRIVHRDEHLLVVDKQPGMVVHPAPGHRDGTLVNAVMHLLGEAPPGGDPLRPGIVHRLDRDTSGLLAVALTEQAHNHLAAQLQDRRMGRTYLAVCWGRWAQDSGSLDGPLGRHPRQRKLMAVLPQGGKPAVTHFEVLEDFGFVQLCRVRLETGRTHQIRVHFAHAGHPVVGDAVYGQDRRVKGIHGADRARAEALLKVVRRQLLHACELKLEHPADGRILLLEAPLPADFTAALDVLRGGLPG